MHADPSALRPTLSRPPVPAPSGGEELVRFNLAALYRLAAFYGWESHIYNHIAARVPGEPCYLVKPHSLMFHEVRASDLLKLRLDGKGVDSTTDVNAAALVIHTAVLNARPDVHYTVHVHPQAAVAIASLSQPLWPVYQRSMLFYNRLSYHDFEGLASDIDEATRLARDLGPTNKALILRNHGLLTAGPTPGDALTLMRYLLEACEIQLALMQTGAEVRIPSPAVCEHTASEYERVRPSLDAGEWSAYLRQADELDPSFRN